MAEPRTGPLTESRDDFDCAACGGTFPKGWTDDEAYAEADAAGFSGDDLVVVCDECYGPMMEMAEREGWDPDA